MIGLAVVCLLKCHIIMKMATESILLLWQWSEERLWVTAHFSYSTVPGIYGSTVDFTSLRMSVSVKREREA